MIELSTLKVYLENWRNMFEIKKYRDCRLCKGRTHVTLTGLQPNHEYEQFYSDVRGNLYIPCPACNATGKIKDK